MTRRDWITLGLLLPVPLLALWRISAWLDWRLWAGFLAAISLAAFLFNRHDKKQARADGPRTRESTLHTLELLGGWPAAFVAQRYLRHKTSKGSYRVKYWAIVSLHQYLALDYLLGWRLIGALASLFH